MKPRPYITALALALGFTTTGNAQGYHWDRTIHPHRIERNCDRTDYYDYEAAAQRRRLIQLQEEANKEARKQRVAAQDASQRAYWEGFARDRAAAAEAEERRKERHRAAVDDYLDAVRGSRAR